MHININKIVWRGRGLFIKLLYGVEMNGFPRRETGLPAQIAVPSRLLFSSSTSYPSLPRESALYTWQKEQDERLDRTKKPHHCAKQTISGLLPCRPQGPSLSDRVEGTYVHLKRGRLLPQHAQCRCICPECSRLTLPLSAK